MSNNFYTRDDRGELAPNRGGEFQGIGAYVYPAQETGTVPLFRWFISNIFDHFYTTDASLDLTATNPNAKREGIACYVFPSQQADTVPLYRWWNSQQGDHAYTLENVPPGDGYITEGIACYVYPTPLNDSVPFFRWLFRADRAADGQKRKEKAREVRQQAAQLAFDRTHPPHQNNGDEQFRRYPMSYTKGLPHDFNSGLLKNEADFAAFVRGINSGNPEHFRLTPLGPASDINNPSVLPTAGDWKSPRGQANGLARVRAWESAAAGLTFDLEGPDAQAVTMPPAPALGSDELTAEMAEVYAQALLREVPFTVYDDNAASNADDLQRAQETIDALNQLPWFSGSNRNGAPLNLQNAFRGFTPGDMAGPYISQFMLAGNSGLNQRGTLAELEASDGQITYGAVTISQKVRTATKNENYMITFEEWFDVQNGADFRGQESYESNDRRFITTPRDLATYVHYDALYEAYLNACLLLLDMGAPFDPGVPFQGTDLANPAQTPRDNDHQQGFAQFGGPHILSLVTEVATRALKAVRYQKFNVHRRLRPETLAARFEKLAEVKKAVTDLGEPQVADGFQTMHDQMENAGIFHLLKKAPENNGNLLLPMAFVEGSPMHPAYGAGHATVAGACVTILKAFFDGSQYLNISADGSTIRTTPNSGDSKHAFVPNATGQRLVTINSEPLTVDGELNKIAANVSIGRDWAGVHYYTDYTESMKLGEEIAIGLLQEQALTYNSLEQFTMTLNKFDGTSITI